MDVAKEFSFTGRKTNYSRKIRYLIYGILLPIFLPNTLIIISLDKNVIDKILLIFVSIILNFNGTYYYNLLVLREKPNYKRILPLPILIISFIAFSKLKQEISGFFATIILLETFTFSFFFIALTPFLVYNMQTQWFENEDEKITVKSVINKLYFKRIRVFSFERPEKFIVKQYSIVDLREHKTQYYYFKSSGMYSQTIDYPAKELKKKSKKIQFRKFLDETDVFYVFKPISKKLKNKEILIPVAPFDTHFFTVISDVYRLTNGFRIEMAIPPTKSNLLLPGIVGHPSIMIPVFNKIKKGGKLFSIGDMDNLVQYSNFKKKLPTSPKTFILVSIIINILIYFIAVKPTYDYFLKSSLEARIASDVYRTILIVFMTLLTYLLLLLFITPGTYVILLGKLDFYKDGDEIVIAYRLNKLKYEIRIHVDFAPFLEVSEGGIVSLIIFNENNKLFYKHRLGKISPWTYFEA